MTSHDRPLWRRKSLAGALLLLGGWGALGIGCGGEEEPVGPPPSARFGAPYESDGSLPGLPAAPAPPGPRPHLLIVVLPGLRADRCGTAVKGSTDALTPHLEALCDTGDAFGHAVTPTPEPGGALASLLTGLAPVRHRVTHVDPVPRLAPGFVTLGEVLKSAGGYATRAFVAEERLARATTLWQGFEVEPRVGLEQAPEALSRWMRSLPAGTPRAAVLVTETLGRGYGAHRTPDGDVREAYETRVRQADARLGELLERLAAEQLDANTLVIVTSTSGTGLGEHGLFGAGADLHDEQIRIPLVFGGSVFLTGEGAVHKTASLVDVLPTILDLLGLPLPEGVDGMALQRVLLGELRRGPVTSEEQQDGANTGDPAAKAVLVSVRSPAWKYLVRLDTRAGTVLEQAYDLDADAGEVTDLARDGSLAGLAFDDAFCEMVERVRDGIWGAVQGANRISGEIYSQGERVVSGRPVPCGK